MRHKYGFHVNRTGDDVLDAIRRIKPQVVKTLAHDVDFLKEVRRIKPDVYVIGRLYKSKQEDFEHDPRGAGQRFADKVLALEANSKEVDGKRLFDAWESYNEVIYNGSSEDSRRRYDEFQVVFGERIKSAGFDPIAMNSGTGNLLGEDLLTYFKGTLETYDVLGFHEYDWPVMWRLHDENIREKNEEGMWLTLRYRRIMEEVRKVYGDRHTVIVTECGMTQGVIGGDDVGPWHSSTVAPALTRKLEQDHGLDLSDGVSEDSYWDSLMWYNSEIMKDDYVKAACLYVVSYEDAKWKSFDHLGGMINRLEAFQSGTMPAPTIHQSPKVAGGKKVQESPSGPSLQTKLLAEGGRHQVIQFNPDAALQKRIFDDGFVPNSSEFTVKSEGITYVAQQAEHLGSGNVRVYYVEQGDWSNIHQVERGAGQGALAQKLLNKGANKQVIRFNPDAALQKVIFAQGFVPNSEEFRIESGDSIYLGQQAEHLGTGAVRVYYVKEGDWGNVQWYERS